MPPRLHTFDLILIAVYLLGITLFGLRFRKSGADKSVRNYFLADNTVPWWAIALSIVSAETSTLTIISVPGVAFAGDFGFLQIVLGYMLGRVVVALLFLPRYFEGRMLTAYQLIDQRFGSTLHKVTAGLFLLTRAAAEGVRVFAVSIVVGIAIGTRDVLSIAIISALTLLYTFEGGMAAVIWTDVVQMAIYLGGTLVAIVTLGARVPGHWPQIIAVGEHAAKFHLFNFALNLTTTYTFWAGLIGGTFLTMASHGTDQLMVQRLLAARSLRESRLALLSSGVVIFVQFTLFLLIGAGLYVFYGAGAGTGAGAPHLASEMWAHTISPDRLFPTFIVAEMPPGIAGLLVAAILAAAMSNLSAALNSLSSTTVVDFLAPMRFQRWRKDERAEDAEENALLLENLESVAYIKITNTALAAKVSTLFWAIVLFAVAVYSVQAGGKGHVVEIGLSIASVAYGALLGVFLLGTLTRYATQTGAILGMVTGFAFNLYLWQGSFPVTFGPVTIPHVAFTWYVFLGAAVTFAVGSLASLLFRKQRHTKTAALLLTLCLFGLSFRSEAEESASPTQTQNAVAGAGAPHLASEMWASGEARPSSPTPTYDFTPITTLLNEAIAAKKLPGAVVLIGHNGKVVFHQAYGVRKLAGEPGLDGEPNAAEPMTEDTIFDMASLSKCLATATAIMQLYEAGKIASFDDPVAKYLPAFAQNGKQAVTLRDLLTHYSGLPPDVDLKDPWGLAAPDKAEGIRRALASPLKTTPGTHFEYSDINYITLGALVEKLTGQSHDVFTLQSIFGPLHMSESRYHGLDRATGPKMIVGSNVSLPNNAPANLAVECLGGCWVPVWDIPRTAPTAHDDEGTPATNPDFDHLLRGTVHDPTTRRMGGVAGHAGVFSTAHDVSLYAQALLDKLRDNTGPFPLKQSTLRLMTQPEQPATAEATATIFTPDGVPTKGVATRGFGWDINSAFSRPRGSIFPIGSFGHTGFTGTSLWIDPASDTYVILLANAIHPHVGPNISPLRGQLATAAAQALGLNPPCPPPQPCHPERSAAESKDLRPEPPQTPGTPSSAPPAKGGLADVQTGIDVLESTHLAALAELATHHNNHLKLGLLTNQTGLDAQGRRTIDILQHGLPQITLTTLFSPEHGLSGKQDTEHLATESDPATHLPLISLYGAKDADRRPRPEDLKNLDAVVIDLQDAGVHFWTYESVVGYFLEAAAREKTAGHDLQIVILDRPPFAASVTPRGPISDPGQERYVNYMPEPLQHAMTLGELARFINGEKHLNASLTVIPMQGWRRTMFYDETGLPWVDPSPNLRSAAAAILYPGVAMVETTNVSIGRGTATPFEHLGAPYLHADELAATLIARHIPGVTITPTTLTIAEDANHYPYHGQTIPGIHLTVTDRTTFDAPLLGVELAAALHHLYPTQFNLAKAITLIANAATLQALEAGEDPHTVAASWAPSIAAFNQRRQLYLLYP